MRQHFETLPFHNLHLLFPDHLRGRVPGGTCSDQTMSFLKRAREAGIDARLHSGFIGGREIHRLARIHLGARVLFADVGNGWPSLRPYPANEACTFRAFGMQFRTEVAGGRVKVFHSRQGRQSLQLEIDIVGRSEATIRSAIARRFGSGIDYPFRNSLRYAQIVNERFLFLRGERLEVYWPGGYEVVEGIDLSKVAGVLQDYFQFDLRPYLRRPLHHERRPENKRT